MYNSTVRRRKRIYVESVFVFYDGPQLASFATKSAAKLIGVAIESSDGEMPFFGAEVSQAQLDKYLAGESDLLYLFMHPHYKRWYIFDYHNIDSDGILVEAQNQRSDIPEMYFPAPGFFSRDHTCERVNKSKLADEIYAVDGTWDLNDFSIFYRKTSDIYYLISTAIKSKSISKSQSAKEKLDSALDQQWLGGFSYVNFYQKIRELFPRYERLQVGSIQYASPGHIKLRGDEDVFGRMRESLLSFSDNEVAAREAYAALRSFLSKSGYLNVERPRTKILESHVEFIDATTNKLLGLVNNDFAALVRSVDSPIVRAKITLSIFRRYVELLRFFEEGRVRIPEFRTEWVLR